MTAYSILSPPLECREPLNYSIDPGIYSIFLQQADFLSTRSDVDTVINDVFEMWSSWTSCTFIRQEPHILEIRVHYDKETDLAYCSADTNQWDRHGYISFNTAKTFCLTNSFIYMFHSSGHSVSTIIGIFLTLNIVVTGMSILLWLIFTNKKFLWGLPLGFACGYLAFFFITAYSISQECYPFIDVFTHEVGHYVGLGHTDYPDSIMNPIINRDIKYACLSKDDIAGSEYLYSRDGNPCVAETHISGLGEACIYMIPISIGLGVCMWILVVIMRYLRHRRRVHVNRTQVARETDVRGETHLTHERGGIDLRDQPGGIDLRDQTGGIDLRDQPGGIDVRGEPQLTHEIDDTRQTGLIDITVINDVHP